MALKTSDGKVIKKQKIDVTQQLLQDEIAKKNDSDRRESFRIANQTVTSDVADLQVSKLPIASMYAAPYNEEWNDFKKLNADKAYELNQSIIDGGLLTPIIVWKMNKHMVKELYENNEDPYGFIGQEYMILAGHSRAYAFVQLYNATKDIKYTKIDAVVRENLTYDEARYIIKVTNFVNRELSAEEKRRNIKFMHDTLSKNKTKGMNIAKKIADDTGSKLRSVQYYISINEKLIPEFIQMHDSKKITQGNAIKLTRLTNAMQQWFFDKYNDSITNDILRGLKPSYTKKEQIESLFENQEVIEYTKVIVDIPKDKEKKFRKMVENWIARNV